MNDFWDMMNSEEADMTKTPEGMEIIEILKKVFDGEEK